MPVRVHPADGNSVAYPSPPLSPPGGALIAGWVGVPLLKRQVRPAALLASWLAGWLAGWLTDGWAGSRQAGWLA